MDPPSKPAISQKEYLKKYFSKSKDKPKKKKGKLSSSSHLKRSQIIDDDLNLNASANIDDEEFNLGYLGDEAPQIAGIIDERPDHIIALEQYGDSKKWKSINEEPGGSGNIIQQMDANDDWGKMYGKNGRERGNRNDYENAGEDIKPPRKSSDIVKKNHKNRDLEMAQQGLKEKSGYKGTTINHSPKSKGKFEDKTVSYKLHSDVDQSPQRKKTFQRRGSGDDQSLQRTSRVQREDSDSDQSPSRKYRTERSKYAFSDQSPPRKNQIDQRKRDWDEDQSSPRNNINAQRKRDSDSDQSPPRKNKDFQRKRDWDRDQSPPRYNKTASRKRDSDSDQSPPRKDRDFQRKRDWDEGQSSPRNNINAQRNRDSDSDQSPPRKNKDFQRKRDWDRDQSPPRNNKTASRKRDSDSDQLPPRKNKDFQRKKYWDRNQSPLRYNKAALRKRDSDSDQSPPRKNKVFQRKRDQERDQSPLRNTAAQRKMDSDSDQSQPRKNKNFQRKRDRERDQSPPRNKAAQRKRDSDSDQSPPRKNKTIPWWKDSDSDQSPPRKNINLRRNSDSDQSPPRKAINQRNELNSSSIRKGSAYHNKDIGLNSKKGYDCDRERDKRNYESRKNTLHYRDKSPPKSKERTTHRDKDREPLRNDKEKESEFHSYSKENASKLEKTLEGKRAGLQDAKNLREEMKSLKEQEEKMFKKMDSSKYGRGSEAVVRDRKTGQIKDLAKEKEESEEKKKERLAREEKYSRWGKGLKQLDDASSKAADARHEMSKPLARYKDDDDLDAFLKAQEREGDPMLDYIRKKQNESHPVEKLKPRYEGSFNPNRFNIRPGHRWDGVDRSNGYEIKWFENINAKKAVQEEAYKWSSADM